MDAVAPSSQGCHQPVAALQDIQTVEALTASTAIAALELVSLLSHVRDAALARRDFQQLIESVTNDFRDAARAHTASAAQATGSRRRTSQGGSGSSCTRSTSDRSSCGASECSDGSEGDVSLDPPALPIRGEHGQPGWQSGRGWGGVGMRESGRSRGWRGSGSWGGGGGAPRLTATLRTRLLRHLLKGPTMKLLCAAAALQQAAPAYNCTVQQRTVAMLRTWALCAPDIAREVVMTPYLLCKCGTKPPLSIAHVKVLKGLLTICTQTTKHGVCPTECATQAKVAPASCTKAAPESMHMWTIEALSHAGFSWPSYPSSLRSRAAGRLWTRAAAGACGATRRTR